MGGGGAGEREVVRRVQLRGKTMNEVDTDRQEMWDICPHPNLTLTVIIIIIIIIIITFLFQRLSMALQRGNAVSFHNTMVTE